MHVLLRFSVFRYIFEIEIIQLVYFFICIVYTNFEMCFLLIINCNIVVKMFSFSYNLDN